MSTLSCEPDSATVSVIGANSAHDPDAVRQACLVVVMTDPRCSRTRRHTFSPGRSLRTCPLRVYVSPATVELTGWGLLYADGAAVPVASTRSAPGPATPPATLEIV